MPKLFELRPRPGPDPRHRLDADKIIETAKNLANDISLRLPGSAAAINAIPPSRPGFESIRGARPPGRQQDHAQGEWD